MLNNDKKRIRVINNDPYMEQKSSWFRLDRKKMASKNVA